MKMLQGYKEVEDFDPDEEYEDEEEEEYITLDLSGIDPALVTSNSQFRLVVCLNPHIFWSYDSLL